MITSRMNVEEEQRFIHESLLGIESATGRRPRGWAGQDSGESERTPRLLAEAGLDHVIDWPNDDQPYLMTVGSPLVSIPLQTEWDDAQLFIARRVHAWDYPRLVADAFETLYREGSSIFVMGIHPWVFGQSHRIRYLEEALGLIGHRKGVWQATSDEVAEWTLKTLGD
jgi:peptidoglycan/xylan/chitin deacetylase (PgdA/CDA1 family)